MEGNYLVLKKESGAVVCQRVYVADNLRDRVVGLMFSDELPLNCDGYLISPGNSIHTFFMKYPIDLVFLDKKYRVVKIIKEMKPWRMTGFYYKSAHVLEIKSGVVNLNIEIGEQLEAICLN